MFRARILVTLIVVLSLFGCNSKTSISGILEHVETNTMVYILQPQTLTDLASPYLGKVVDSVKVNKDGHFSFQLTNDFSEKVLLELVVQSNGQPAQRLKNENPLEANYMPLVWKPGDRLELKANAQAFQKTCFIENPSEENKALMQLRDVKMEAFIRFLKDKQWDVHEGMQLLEKEHALLNYQKQLIAFARETLQPDAAMVAIRWVSPQNDYERIPEFLVEQCAKWQDQAPEYPWVKELCKLADTSNLPVLVGDFFPDSLLPTVSGDTISIKEALGAKLTIVDIWASWCAPCRKENKVILDPLWKAYHDKGLQIIGYGLESDEQSWKAAIQKDQALWLQTSHLEGDEAPFMQLLRIQMIPANFILDAQGKVLTKNLHGEELRQLVVERLE
ncbi:MAG: TlpA family protein disulfide reductase [Mangrovimonas sp.]|nr:TlpA family protein disulfide reductase [Mangrovimonas sp.]